MNKEEFLIKLQDIFECEEELQDNMNLSDIEEWDSLTMMAVMAFFNKTLSISLLPAEVREMKTINDLLKKAGL